MAGLHVFRSNHLEALGEKLAEVVRAPLASPLQPETIVVQSLGMRRWVSFELAARLGVTMNCQFPFFQEFAHRLLGSQEGEDAFARNALLWRIFALLPHLLDRPGFEPLQRYRAQDALSALRRFQLSQQIATVFDRYIAHSPDRLLGWQKKGEADWQAQLWRELARPYLESHPPARLKRFMEEDASLDPAPGGFSSRISVFGISLVPPFHLHLLAAAARFLDVHLFLLEPTDQYWGDIVSRKEQDRILRRSGARAATAEDLHLEIGNELLASLGKPGRTFAREVQELEPSESRELFIPPKGESLLSAVRRDIFAVSEPAEHGQPALIASEDGSIQIHCCHGPIRELQVLHDRLLDLFERLPGIMPRDVLVTMPEVETYAPLIEAVFDSPESETKRLPFSIADRSARAESQIARALLMLLELHGGRFGANTVLELLEIKVVRDRFEIAESELDLLRDWVARAGIRWGIDGSHRASFGLPAFEQNSWRQGLDRLLLGYALPGDGATLYEGILPFPEIEGSMALLLGRFVDFAEKLFRAVPDLGAPRTLDQWEKTLRELLDTFMADRDELADELKRVRGAIRQIGALAEWHDEPVSFHVLRAHVKSIFSMAESGFGFLAGHITFCSLKPMRSVPFRVICVLGLNADAFPRHEPQLSFDLLASEARGAGRARRDDDRQLFLETILSARDTLYLSYSGLSARDDAESPPSVVVSELLDYVTRNFRAGSGAALTVIQHPLQPFSARYFAPGSSLFSYSAEQCAASSAAATPRVHVLVEDPKLLPEIAADRLVIDLADLANFFANPAKHFVRKCLRARPPRGEERGVDCEPLKVVGLDRWQLQATLAAAGLQPAGAPGFLPVARAQGVLPSGFFGASEFGKLDAEIQKLLAEAEPARAGGPAPSAPRRVHCGDWEIEGTLSDLFAGGIVQVIGWKMRGRDRLRAWVRHLFLNAGGDAEPKTTQLFCTDRTVEFPPLSSAPELLADLLSLYAAGQRAPLPFFSESSFAFARTRRFGKSRSDCRYAAWKEWEPRERSESHIDLCFHRVADPLDARWEELAVRICGPMLEIMREDKFA